MVNVKPSKSLGLHYSNLDSFLLEDSSGMDVEVVQKNGLQYFWVQEHSEMG